MADKQSTTHIYNLNARGDRSKGLSPEQMEEVFEQIATLANTLDTEFYYTPHTADRDEVEIENHLNRLRTAIRHIGVLADFGAGSDIRGGIEAWLLSPTFKEKGLAA